MARPTKAKDPKPKAEGGGGDAANNALGGFTGILINAVLTIVIAAIFVGANYLIVQNLVSSLGPQTEGHEEEGHGEGHGGSMFFPYDLKEFIVNLNSPGGNKYLKVQIALNIQRLEEEPEIGVPADAGGGHGGGHGGGGGGGDPKEFYNTIMEPYKMPIRDVIITKLSAMSAEELSSTAGKEQAKDSIKEEINTIMPENRQVLSVNFGEFIIQ